MNINKNNNKNTNNDTWNGWSYIQCHSSTAELQARLRQENNQCNNNSDSNKHYNRVLHWKAYVWNARALNVNAHRCLLFCFRPRWPTGNRIMHLQSCRGSRQTAPGVPCECTQGRIPNLKQFRTLIETEHKRALKRKRCSYPSWWHALIQKQDALLSSQKSNSRNH